MTGVSNRASAPVIVVLSAHRSGSSAITRGLQALGVSLGERLMPPLPNNNDKGFFEDLDIYELNERLLKKLGSAWYRLGPLDAQALAGPNFSAERREALQLLAPKLQTGTFGFKDPRTALLLPFWQCVFEDLDLEDRYVVTVRNPIESAVSLNARDGQPLSRGVVLWAKHLVEGLRRTQAKPRVFVGYDNVLADPARELGRIAGKLDLDAPDPDSEAVKAYASEFLSPELRHSRVGAKELERSGLVPRFVIDLYALLTEAAAEEGGGDIDDRQLDSILAGYEDIVPLLDFVERSDRARAEAQAATAREIEAKTALAAQITQLNETVAEAQRTNEAQRARTEAESAAKAQLEAKVEEIEQERARLSEAFAAAARELDAQRASLAKERAEKDALSVQLNAVKEARDQALRTVEAELQDLSDALAAASRELEARRSEAAEKEALAERLKAAEDALKRRPQASETESLRTSLRSTRAELQSARAELQSARAELEQARRKFSEFKRRHEETSAEGDRLAGAQERQLARANERAKAFEQRYREARRDLLLARSAVTAMRSSVSWRVTAPMRAVSRIVRNPIAGSRALLRPVARAAWRRLPLSAEQRGRLAHRLFSSAPALFSWTGTYRAWRETNGRTSPPQDVCEEPPPDPTLEGCVPLTAKASPTSVAARAIAFYLPQFHPIPENNAWWGEGFTEWTKVRAATPAFDGHYQPHEPGELGYYDLLADDDVLERQAELAKLHGLGGFCFYFYWFGGKRLLEAPIIKFQQSAHIDMPFCLCWANENWTRRWDGKAHEILIAQQHSPQDDIAFIEHVSRYFNDKRYIRIGGRPLLVVYRPSLLPSARATAERWRQWLRENGFGEVYLAYTQSFERAPPEQYGFDAAVEFPPNNMGLRPDPTLVSGMNPDARLSIYDWRRLADRARRYVKPAYKLFRGVSLTWDNTPRRPKDGAVFVNVSPSRFREWLSNAVRDTVARFEDPEERLVFINAWNEWAEGAHLEPDKRYGYAWLEAARRALDTGASGERKIIVVTHDLHKHGAQYISLNIVRALKRHYGFEVACISGQDGDLAADFAREGSLQVLDRRVSSEAQIDAAIGALTSRGFRHAIVNSAASAWIAPLLARRGVRMIGLVHELPRIIEDMKLGHDVRELDRRAEAIVFPSHVVEERDAQALGIAWRNSKVIPQGLYKSGVATDLDAKDAARRAVAKQLGLPESARIVLGVGYADERKGPDIFIAWAAAAARRWPDLHFVWLGKKAPEFTPQIERALAAAGPRKANIHFPGFVEDTGDLYLAASLYALTSREDPFPSTALEALAAGAPVIMVSGTGGIEDLAGHGCVKAIASTDPDVFVAAASIWIEDAKAARAAGEAGRDLIRERFGTASYAGALTDVLGMNLPNVSAVVPNYNYARHLEQRLASILDQTLAPREIIVLDDASTDDSIAVAERVLGRSPINWRIVRNVKNSGDVFAQWRKGAELARGELVWIAEADDWAEPRFLETAAAAFQRPDVVISMTQSRQADEDGRILAGHYLDYVKDVDPEKWTRGFVGEGPKEVREGLSIKNTIPNASAVVFRRAPLLETLSRYAREIGSYRVAGDWCVYVNMLRNGALAFSSEALNTHRRHDASVTISRFGLPELAEIARMQTYVAREFSLGPEHAPRARAYLERLSTQFRLSERYSAPQIEGAMRGVVAALSQRA